ncbi:hypothetical protein GOBAR_AA01488 [Gossypium barbadense]|uniref:Uncharacterized protein n=2 Tax=Gossypium TaxID=3633 RepID=A0ABR0P1C5_GOSAR|nr:hypothetical protein PVK06_026535 [Gossypium arboreum]PPS19082.1 hypothetical protein GOBAR_AA01488 [Gossypium barbadense]
MEKPEPTGMDATFDHGDTKSEWPNSASRVDDPWLATFCEAVEKENSNHLLTEGLANSTAIARGDAEAYINFARSGYKEKIESI